MAAERTGSAGRRGTVAAMSDDKPHVYVPAGETPPPDLVTEDLEVGDGDEAIPGSNVEVHYVGVSWRTRKQFDASWDRGDTFRFGLGGGQVIQGWDEGVAGMKVGGRRRIVIPPGKAYGKQGAGGVIGPDETLVCVVDLISVG
jgi:peptidylprolyl isomerase